MAQPTHRHLLGDKELIPVILGGDIGGYSLARAFHEAFGVRSVIVSATLGGVVRDSAIVINQVEPRMDDPDVAVQALQEIAARYPAAALMAFASADWLVRTLVERRAELEPRYVIPYVDREVLDLVTSKEAFAQLCEEYGLDHPATITVDLAQGPAVDASELPFPVIAKAADSGDFHAIHYPGKEKVSVAATPADLDALLRTVYDAGYRGTFLIQDMIPGDDAGLRILNTYVRRDGSSAYTVFGHVLLQEHTPSTVGNSSVVLVTDQDDVVAQAERLFAGIGWRGFASIDMKYDPRTGRTVFFELNPRLSRSNSFVTGAGINPAVAYVREYLLGLDPAEGTERPHEHLFTVVPRRLVMRYVIDAELRPVIRRLYRRGRVRNPLWNPRERHPRRLAYVVAHQLNQLRKYRRFYPLAVQRAERDAVVGLPHYRPGRA